jgi:hypothetical protein
MENERFQREMLRRMDVLIALHLEGSPAESGTTTSSKIRRLKDLNLAPSEIASIIGKPTSYVTATLAQQKKRPKKGAAGAGE